MSGARDEGPRAVELRLRLRPLPELAALSPAERAVVRALARGAAGETIARDRGVSIHTLSKQVSSIFHKLRVHSRAELAGLLADVDLGASGGPTPPSRHQGRHPRERERAAEVLVAEDQPELLTELAIALRAAGYRVVECGSLAAACDTLEQRTPDAALLDMRLGTESALDILRAGAPCPVVLLSGMADREEAFEGLLLGASEFVEKSAGPDAVRLAVGDAVASRAVPVRSVHGEAVHSIEPHVLARRLAEGSLHYVGTFDHRGERSHVFESVPGVALTRRQRAIVAGLLAGAPVKAVAAAAGVSEATVWSDLGLVLEGLGLSDRLTMTSVLGPLASAWSELP